MYYSSMRNKTKKCKVCLKIKDEGYFEPYRAYCVDCREQYGDLIPEPGYWQNEDRRRKWIAAKKEYIDNIKDVPCADCGKRFHPVCMDFDHLDRSDKRLGISKAVHGAYGIGDIVREIAKCEIVCSNCHRLRTHFSTKGINPI